MGFAIFQNVLFADPPFAGIGISNWAALNDDKHALEIELEEYRKNQLLWTSVSGSVVSFFSSNVSVQEWGPIPPNDSHSLEGWDHLSNAVWLCPTHMSAKPRLCLGNNHEVCGHCHVGAFLADEVVSVNGIVFISKRCLLCGRLRDDDAESLFARYSTDLVDSLDYLDKIRPFECFCPPELLLRLVKVVLSILLYSLKTGTPFYAIAICQRSFFTHHGAHPPDIASITVGASSSGVFQPRLVA